MSQLSLLDISSITPVLGGKLIESDPPVDFIPNFLSEDEANTLLFQSLDTVEWSQNSTKMYGKTIPLPRREAIYGDRPYTYTYSGGKVSLTARLWDDAKFLHSLKTRVEQATGFKYQLVIGNHYRNGRDSIGFHDDGRPELGKCPAIASISLGAARTFKLRQKVKGSFIHSFEMTHGSLILMRPGCQENWAHAVPKTSKPVGARVNWTFRPWKEE
ncbi:MAG: alpha-ketoglutarate-dependent dioxygenase AlkB [Cyanobacteria bacterium P01_E01_bin.6]